MGKSILIIGAGPGLSRSVAERFGREGFSVSLVSRNVANLENLKSALKGQGINSVFAAADAANASELNAAIGSLSQAVAGFDVVLYNAAMVKALDIMDEDPLVLTHDFSINVSNALTSLQAAYQGLRQKKGAFLLTGGGLGVTPSAAYGSLSIGKAGMRSLAYQLHDRLNGEDIYVGLLTVAGFINPDSPTHSPELLANLFWKMYTERSQVEIQQ